MIWPNLSFCISLFNVAVTPRYHHANDPQQHHKQAEGIVIVVVEVILVTSNPFELVFRFLLSLSSSSIRGQKEKVSNNLSQTYIYTRLRSPSKNQYEALPKSNTFFDKIFLHINSYILINTTSSSARMYVCMYVCTYVCIYLCIYHHGCVRDHPSRRHHHRRHQSRCHRHRCCRNAWTYRWHLKRCIVLSPCQICSSRRQIVVSSSVAVQWWWWWKEEDRVWWCSHNTYTAEHHKRYRAVAIEK